MILSLRRAEELLIILMCFPLTAGVSMFSQYTAVETAGVNPQTLGHQVTEAGGIQVGSTADNPMFGQTAQLPGDVGHNVHCVGRT